MGTPIDQTFSYDALNRLTTVPGGGYSYDAAGNLLQITAAAAPLIVVEQPAGTGLTDNVSSVGFGSVNVGSSSSAFTFTVKNSGTADLTGLVVTKDGSHSGDFAINTTGMSGTVPAGSSSTTFTVTFTPSASGARTAALHIASNDAARSPFDIALTGTGAGTMYTVTTSSIPAGGGTTGGGGSFASGSTQTVTATANGGYSFVNWTESGGQVSTVPNYAFQVTGNRSLAANFVVTLDSAAALDAAGLTFGAAGTTPWFGQSAVNRDGVDAVRSGAIGDSGVSSLETSVTGPASVSFYWKVSSETNYDFLRVYVDDVDQGGGISGSVDWVQRTLTIPAGSHTLRWTYSKDVSLAIGSDAGYVDQLVVQSTLPMITVEEPVGMALVDGTASIAFGTINQGSSSAARVFTIRNTGGGDLTGLAVTKSGAHNADFAVNTTGMSASLAPGGSTTFTVAFSPSASGARTAALQIASNDTARSPFDIALTGTGQFNALETWRQTHFGTTANTGNAADTADPDKDGIQNLAEFAFGLHPNQNSAGLLPQPQLTGGSLSVTFTKPAGVTGIGYDAETSATLLPGSWTPATNTGVFPAFQFSVPVGTAPRMFMRLKVTALLPPPPPPPLTPP